MGAAPPNRLRLRRNQRLQRSRDFTRLRREGRRLACGCLAANWQCLPDGSLARVGVVVSGRVGKAVARSRIRRLLRQAFRVHQHDLVAPVDLVLVARQSIAGRPFADVERDFLTTMRRAGLLKPASPVPSSAPR